MIKQISIQNFQSHKNTTIEFDKGVNVIVGTSDSGKTAILRALNWVLTNRPLGDAFRSNWGGETSVIITKDDFQAVGRDKGKSNRYYMLEVDNNGEPATDLSEFKAMGTAVPKEIVDTLNIGDINIQNQLDPPYLLSSSAGEVAQILNSLVGLDDIDMAQSNIASSLRQIKQDIVYKENTLETALNALKAFDYLDEAQKTLNALNAIVAQIAKSQSVLDSLTQTLSQICQLEIAISPLEDYISHEKEVDAVISKAKTLETKKREKAHLITEANSAIWMEQEIEKRDKIISKEKTVNILIDKSQKIVSLDDKFVQLQPLLDQIEDSKRRLFYAETSLEKLEKEFKKLMPNICPLCGK